jgi:hypothetical protein
MTKQILTLLCIIVLSVSGHAEALTLPAEMGTHTIRLKFGVQRTTPANWDGSITLTGGRVTLAEGWQFERGDAVVSPTQWKISTHLSDLSDSRHQPRQRPSLDPVKHLRVNGIYLHIQSPAGRFTASVQTAQGAFTFNASDRRPGDKLTFLDGDVEVEFLPPTYRIGAEEDADEYPSAIIDGNNRRWIAWVAFRDDQDRVLVASADNLQSPAVVSGALRDNFRTALGEDDAGGIWVAWSAKRGDRWLVFGSRFDGSNWTNPQPLTDTMGPDIYHKLHRDAAGRLWLVWQGNTKADSDIYARYLQNGNWTEPLRVSESDANDWEPAVTSDSRGTVWFAWDTYDKGDYDIHLRPWRSGALGPVRKLTSAREMQVRPSLVCDSQDRLWVAWEEAGVNWGKDWSSMRFTYGGEGLYTGRWIKTVIVDGDEILQPTEQLEASIQSEFSRYQQMPQLFADGRGGIWMAFRVRAWHVQNVRNNWGYPGGWQAMLTRYEGARWSVPMPLPQSTGGCDMRITGKVDSDKSLFLVYPTDCRDLSKKSYPQSWQITLANVPAPPQAGPFILQDYFEETIPYGRVHPEESTDLTRIRRYEYRVNNRTFKIYRGDLHRHTDISGDGPGDGSLLDLFRYARDAAGMDYAHVGDHTYGGGPNQFVVTTRWWRTEKMQDLFLVPGSFVPLFGYERSKSWPNGHRNIVRATRGVKWFAGPRGEADDGYNVRTGPVLFPHLKETGGVSIPHSGGTDQGTDYEDFDPEVEPVIELYQGLHASYEYEGAPRAESEDNWNIFHVGFQKNGFWWKALAKGRRLGVIAASDHIATHDSYGMILTDDFTREGLVEGLRSRHTYAATDNIIMDFRMDANGREYLLGEELTTDEQPILKVHIVGTGLIRQIDLIKNNTFIHTTNPGQQEVSFTFVDSKLEPGDNYYYVRVMQEDRNLAWSSPIWVQYTGK